jgi:flagellar motility protein MotE (MotC chaperone)
MFEFDFRDSAQVQAAIADSLAKMQMDSLMVSDSLQVTEEVTDHNAGKLNEKLNDTKTELSKVEQELDAKNKQIELLQSQLEQKQEVEHAEWLKSTIKLYEEMESNKAGKLLSALPDDEARELIYTMKKKKAAEILSSLDTETVKRLTRSKQ